MKTIIAHRTLLVPVALAAAACQNLPGTTEGSQPSAAPQISEDSLRDRAQTQLADGVKQYDAGDYDNAVKSLSASLEHGMLSKAEQARARKYLAFSHCVSGREILCRDEFRKDFEIYPDFALTAAEDGHPIWGPVYRSVRTQLIAEREAQRPKTLIPLARAEQMLQDGMVKYDAGEYPAARTLLEAALKEGLSTKENQVRAMKTVAFTMCLEKK
ncbi:MAG TPA: TssQ family T6SS-associated lipoprotein, partial [Usitatibacter sp.]|nr:TssQ family T6SS-associated lipoprotein [Usitatibacter sp.]